MRDFDWGEVIFWAFLFTVIAAIGTIGYYYLRLQPPTEEPLETQLKIALPGCVNFLSSASDDCEYEFKSDDFDDIGAALSFKSKNHRGAFWLGFAIPSYINCRDLRKVNTEKLKGTYPTIFKEDIALGKLYPESDKSAPYTWAYISGQKTFYKVLSTFGDNAACVIILEAAGPNGKIAHWVDYLDTE